MEEDILARSSESDNDDLDIAPQPPKNKDPEDEHSKNSKKKKKRKALIEFRARVEESILKKTLLGSDNENPSDIKLWGVPLLPSQGHKNTDTVLKKFLKAKDYKVSDALEMLQKAMKWRREYKVEGILSEKFGSDVENIGYIDGLDKAGHPLCYQTFDVYKNKEVSRKRFKTKEGLEEFIRWRIQFVERCIRKLDFKPGGADSVVQIVDMTNVSRPFLNEIIRVIKKYLPILQENYPGIIFRTVIINVPIWFLALHRIQSRYIAQRYDFKTVFVRPARVTETLLKFISPENIPVQYGGLRRRGTEFSSNDKVHEHKLRGSATESVEISTLKTGTTIIWDLTVVGFDVNFKEEFVPDDECSYKVLLKTGKQIGKSVTNSFYITEPGKIVITISNPTYKSRRIFYRYKVKETVPIYMASKKD